MTPEQREYLSTLLRHTLGYMRHNDKHDYHGISMGSVADLLKTIEQDESCEGCKSIIGETIEGWISISEELPESDRCVILYSPTSGASEGSYLSPSNTFISWRWSCALTNVTHWMPLPEPPKEKDDVELALVEEK